MLYPIQNQIRNKMDLSGIWDFQTDPEEVGEAQGWPLGLPQSRPIAVPGSWNEQYSDLFGYLDLAWYVRRVHVPPAWQGQRVFLRVGSACYHATVYVNGVQVGTHEGGHLPFAFDITDHLRWGEEAVVAIAVENRLMPTRVPSGNMPSMMGLFAGTPRTTFDFYPFAGLHRPVWLYTVPSIHIQDITVTTHIQGTDGQVQVTVQLNRPDPAQGTLRLRGEAGGAEREIQASLSFVEGVAQATLEVPQARFWSDRDPYLYQLTVDVAAEGADGRVADRYSLPVGIRTIAVQDGQILLNGQPVKLNGFGRHEDFYASGKGLNLPLLVKDYHLMRWVGANSYRTSHYPYSEEEMQLADREGFLIIDETPAVSLQFGDAENIPVRLQVCLQQLQELIARDKNHPSVVMWCVANEPMPARFGLAALEQNTPDPAEGVGKEFLETLLARARALDPTRPVTIATIMGGPRSWMEQCDVIAMNRYWGWYRYGGELDKARDSLAQELDEVWTQWRRPIILTEFGADTLAGHHGHPPLMWTEEYQAELIRMYLEVAAERDFVAGMQVWNFADFAAVQSIMRVDGVNHKGIFTRSRQPKLAAHVLREFWARE
ncbi:MAG: beta-glucuronidase [Litorilinea sp.]|nr:MAG: beta-glucuronidase [Litorilinea sp.]